MKMPFCKALLRSPLPGIAACLVVFALTGCDKLKPHFPPEVSLTPAAASAAAPAAPNPPARH